LKAARLMGMQVMRPKRSGDDARRKTAQGAGIRQRARLCAVREAKSV
jgi:hypothetical protein